MKVINLFDSCSGLFTLKEIYNIPEATMANIIRQCLVRDSIYYDLSDDCVNIFLRETGIHPDTFDISDVKVHCKHVTTVFDNGVSIKRNGLIPLNRLLEEPSVLRAFLLENGIEISPREQYISINGMKHWIPMESRGCDTDEWENVGLLSAILYHDHGEVEAFIAGDQKEIIGYSTVKNNPEILHSVETVVKRLTRKDLGLEAKWQKKQPQTNVAEFDAKVLDLSYCNTFKCRHDYPSTYDELEEFFEKPKNDNENIWINEWIISSCLYNSCPGYDWSPIAVGIRSNVAIPGDSITLTTVER